MKKRQWTNQQKMKIVVEVFKRGSYVAELCTRYDISQGRYYKWRGLLLNGADRVFVPDSDNEKERMRKRIDKLNQTIGELTVELKKTEKRL